jgi:PTH2 family peptidyl-tRNA hydrolase
MNKSKQVIVMRKSFTIDGKKITPRKGKYIAQGAHASMKAILDNMNDLPDDGKMILYYKYNSALEDWIKNAFTKVTCVVETEEEIIALYEKAQQKGMLCSLIKDAGLTEFGGVPTITCCAIGPAWSDEVDEITGNLELF